MPTTLDKLLGQPQIELRKVREHRGLSEETPCYAADVYVDGKLFCHASNRGHGGCDDQCAPKGVDYATFTASLRALEARIKESFPPDEFQAGGKTHTIYETLESRCHDALIDIAVAKMIKRDTAKKLMFIKPSDGKLYSVKKVPNPALLEPQAKAVRDTHRVTLINDMPISVAVAAYRKALA